MLPQTFTKESTIRVGVLLAPPPVQLLDLACVDIFYTLSQEYFKSLEMLPQAIKDLAIHNVEIFYIADKEAHNVQTASDGKRSFTTITAHMNVEITADLASPQVQPGNLTILVIPGPDPSSIPSERDKDFLRAHAVCGTTDIISICTGIFPVCYSGICDGKVVTAPRGLLPEVTKKFKNVKKFEDKRWSHDYLSPANGAESKGGNKNMRRAELWSSAGITNGGDAVAAYVREHFNRELGEIVLRLADVGDRPRDYDVGRTADGMWWLSTILTAIFKGFWKK